MIDAFKFDHVVRLRKDCEIPLIELRLPPCERAPPGDILAFIREADRRIERFQMESRIPGFVPSDFVSAYGIIRALAEANVARGSLFCEWGSGFGVVACLAAMLDFQAWGIEVEGELIDAAQKLADDFELPVEFIHGSFIPPGSTAAVDDSEGFVWLTQDAGAYGSEMAPDDFDIIFAYPWPDEEHVIDAVFEQHASTGAILVTYHSGDAWKVRRLEKPKRKGPKRGR